jgi:peptidoglycan/LPS O-acetylase OafA/YrhL
MSGVIFYLIWSKRTTLTKCAMPLGIALLAIHIQDKSQLDLAVISIFFGVFLLISTNNLGSLNPPSFLVSLGNLTYSLYLIHQNVGYAVIRKIEPIYGGLVGIFVALSTSLIIAFFLNKFIEKPSLAKLRGWHQLHIKNKKQLFG